MLYFQGLETVSLFLEKASKKGKTKKPAVFNNYFKIKKWVDRLEKANTHEKEKGKAENFRLFLFPAAHILIYSG